jgi:hypothetical protein
MIGYFYFKATPQHPADPAEDRGIRVHRARRVLRIKADQDFQVA